MLQLPPNIWLCYQDACTRFTGIADGSTTVAMRDIRDVVLAIGGYLDREIQRQDDLDLVRSQLELAATEVRRLQNEFDNTLIHQGSYFIPEARVLICRLNNFLNTYFTN